MSLVYRGESRIFKKALGWLSFALFFLAVPLHAEFRILHSFHGGASDGKNPYGTLILVGSTLYGTTPMGGADDHGTIFKINADGLGFKVLHSFTGGTVDASYPNSSLILKDSTLYGTTVWGGDNDRGSIFRINTDGTGFKVIHSFAEDVDGMFPGRIISDGSTLYGMTMGGGALWQGAIFRIQTDGTGFNVIHSLAGLEGAYPEGGLVLSGSMLYGMSNEGGGYNSGTVFKVKTDGTGFTMLHEFNESDGKDPRGSLILSGTTLYGMTNGGFGNGMSFDDHGPGLIFKVQTNGSGFKILHVFDYDTPGGAYPSGDLILNGSTLFSMADANGVNTGGAMFKINTSGLGFQVVHSFDGGPSDGKNPNGSLLQVLGAFYGMTTSGGAADLGVIFCLATGKADIALSESADNLNPAPGGEINLTINATNNGPSKASGLQVLDPIRKHNGLSYISSSASQGAYKKVLGVWNVGKLARGATAALTLKALVVGSGTITNSASVSGLNQYDPVSANNSASVTISVSSFWPASEASKKAGRRRAS